MQGDTGFAVLTGSRSQVTVIDCDTQKSYRQLVDDFPELNETLTVRTAKGFHLYCRYEPRAPTSAECFQSYPSVDVRNDDGMAYAPPTKYRNCVTGAIERYEVVQGDEALVPFPESLLDDLKSGESGGRGARVSTPEATLVKHSNPNESRVVATTTSCPTATVEELDELLRVLPDDPYLVDWKYWHRIGAILHFELQGSAEARALFLRHSQRPPKYRNVCEEDIGRVWTTYRTQRRSALATVKTLYHWCHAVDSNHATELWNRFRQTRECLFVSDSEDEEEHVSCCSEEAFQADQPAEDCSEDPRFDFAAITTTQVARFLVVVWGDDYKQAVVAASSPMHGPPRTQLLWWDGNVWNAELAHQSLLRLIGGRLYERLHSKCLWELPEGRERTAALRELIKLQSRRYKEDVAKEVRTELPLLQHAQFDTGAEQHDNLHFANGVLMLDRVRIDDGATGRADVRLAFRARTRFDLVTATLPFDFEVDGPDAEAAQRVRLIYQQIQPDPAQRAFQLDWLAYCTTGRTSEQRFKANIGYSAANGKSTECNIHATCLPLYSKKLHNTTFNAGNQKVHKFIIALLRQPVRYAYVEELDRTRLDGDLLKDFVDGSRLTVEVMYGTELEAAHQAKLTTTSNKDFNVEADQGILRRGMVQHYTSRFVSDPQGDNEFPIDRELGRLFQADRFRNAYVWMLLPHVVRYYQHGFDAPVWAERQFREIAQDYDEFKTAINECCVAVPNGRVWRDDLLHELRSQMARPQLKWTHVLPEIRRFGLVFQRSWRARDRHQPDISRRGAVVGLSWRPSEEAD